MVNAFTVLQQAFQLSFRFLEQLYVANNVSIVYGLLSVMIGQMVVKLFLFDKDRRRGE